MADINKGLKNLKNYDRKTQALVLELYNQVEATLKDLIKDDSVKLRQAQAKLMREYDKALESTDFIAEFRKLTVTTIVDSSYVKAELGGTKQKWADYLYNKSLFDDKVKLSTRIRNNSNLIVQDHRIALRNSLKSGKTISQIVGNIGDDTFKDFERKLPKYIDDLKAVGVPQSRINSAMAQVNKIKTKGLRADYTRLIDSIQSGKDIDKQTYFAIERRTKYYSQRLARSETIRSISVVNTHEALKDEDTQYVQNMTLGNNPCPYCVAMENMGFVPVASSTIAIHHSNCSCQPKFKRTIKRPEPISQQDFLDMQQKQIDKFNRKAEREGRPKTYIKPQPPVNLRESDLLRDWDDFKLK